MKTGLSVSSARPPMRPRNPLACAQSAWRQQVNKITLTLRREKQTKQKVRYRAASSTSPVGVVYVEKSFLGPDPGKWPDVIQVTLKPVE